MVCSLDVNYVVFIEFANKVLLPVTLIAITSVELMTTAFNDVIFAIGLWIDAHLTSEGENDRIYPF